MIRKYDIIVCDENDLVREKIAGVLSRINTVRVVSQTAEITCLKSIALKYSPDLILIDLMLASSDIEKANGAIEICPDAVMLLYSENTAGCQGLISKTRSGTSINIKDIELEVTKHCIEKKAQYEYTCRP